MNHRIGRIQKQAGVQIRQFSSKKPARFGYIFAFLSVGVLLAACTVPIPGMSPNPTPEGVLLSDAFSPPNVAWARFDAEESAVYAQEGELFLEDRGKGVAVSAPLADKTYEDVIVRVQMRHVQGTVDNWMGVVCRQQDAENYYLLAISADGFYLVLRVEDGAGTALAGPKQNDAINQGKAENNVIARCQDNSLSLRVNGDFVVARTDDTFNAPGQVALFADAVESGETATTAFDDFELSVP